jgi:hypothetical protein
MNLLLPRFALLADGWTFVGLSAQLSLQCQPSKARRKEGANKKRESDGFLCQFLLYNQCGFCGFFFVL